MINLLGEKIELVEKELNSIEPISKNMERFLKMRIVLFFTFFTIIILILTISSLKPKILEKESKSLFFLQEKQSIFLLEKVQELLEEILNNNKNLIDQKIFIENFCKKNIKKKDDEQKDLEKNDQTLIRTKTLENENIEKIYKEWSKLKEKCLTFISSNKKRILNDLEIILNRTINNFEFRALCELASKNKSEENKNFEDKFLSVRNQITNSNDKKIFEEPLNQLYYSVCSLHEDEDYSGSLDPNNNEFKFAFESFKRKLNVNQNLFDNKIQELKDAFNSISDNNSSIDSDIKILKESFNNPSTIKTKLLSMEIFYNRNDKYETCIDEMSKKLKARLIENFNTKFSSIEKLDKNLYSSNKTKIIDAFDIFLLVTIFFTKLTLLLSVIKAKKEIKYYKPLISITITSVIIFLFVLLHRLLFTLSIHLSSIAWFLYKIDKKNKFYPWIFFNFGCLKICKFCIFTLTFIINNGIVFPLLIVILEQKFKAKIIYSKTFTFVLLSINLVFFLFCFVAAVIVVLKELRDYFINVV